MLENKNHKKISLSGKSLLMGTLSTAAIVLSASTANAATINENQTVEVTEKDSADKSTSDVAEDANTKKSNENTETTERILKQLLLMRQ